MTILDEKIASAEAKLKRVQEELLHLKKRQTITCNSCKAKPKLDSIILQVIQYYVSPHGCTGGDYWTEGDSPEFNVTCECGAKTRYHDYDRTDWQKPKPISITKFIVENRRYFKGEEIIKRGQGY